MMKKNTEKKLKSLIALASSLLPASGASSQIIYTDVSPDLVISANEQYTLDLNNDGIFDFNLRIDSIQSSKKIGLNGYGSLDGEMAIIPSTGQPFLSVLGPDDYIGAAQNWLSEPSIAALLYINYGPVYWENNQDNFAGLRFNLGVDTHYGWVRARVGTSPLSLTIRDYAYNSTPDQPINAAGVLIENLSDMSEPSVYASQHALTVLLPNENHRATISLYNMMGEKLISRELNAVKSHLPLPDIAAGIYLVTVLNSTRHYSKTVRID